MDRRLIRASQRLSESKIAISLEGYDIEVFWFRAMSKTGNWFIRRHAHSTYEFHFCAKGSCLVNTDSSSFMIREGYFYLSSPGVYHTQRPANREEFIEYSLNCSIIRRHEAPRNSLGRELDQLFSVFSKSPCFAVADHYGVMELFDEALEEAEQRRLGYEWILHSLVPRILAASARAIELEKTPHDAKSAAISDQNPRMAAIEEYVNKNIHKALSPNDLARLVNLSEKQVSRIIYSHRGFSTKKFITRSKLNRAKEILSSTDTPIKEIAAGLGFSSEHYFNSVFKLHVGCPPGVFRNSMSPNNLTIN